MELGPRVLRCFFLVCIASVYLIASTGETLAAIFPGLEQDKSTVNRENSMEPRKITGEVLMVVMPASNLVEHKTTGIRTAPMP